MFRFDFQFDEYAFAFSFELDMLPFQIGVIGLRLLLKAGFVALIFCAFYYILYQNIC